MHVGTLSLFTNSNGGIIDDCIITRTGVTSFYIVSNASRAKVDLQHLKVRLRIIGASRSAPHTNHVYEKITLPMYVCIYLCSDASFT